MKTISLFSEKFEKCFLKVLVSQFVIMILSALMLDGGLMIRVNSIVLAAFWCGMAVIFGRRRFSPTESDLVYFKWGFPLLVLICNPVAMLVWHIRGFI